MRAAPLILAALAASAAPAAADTAVLVGPAVIRSATEGCAGLVAAGDTARAVYRMSDSSGRFRGTDLALHGDRWSYSLDVVGRWFSPGRPITTLFLDDEARAFLGTGSVVRVTSNEPFLNPPERMNLTLRWKTAFTANCEATVSVMLMLRN